MISGCQESTESAAPRSRHSPARAWTLPSRRAHSISMSTRAANCVEPAPPRSMPAQPPSSSSQARATALSTVVVTEKSASESGEALMTPCSLIEPTGIADCSPRGTERLDEQRPYLGSLLVHLLP